MDGMNAKKGLLPFLKYKSFMVNPRKSEKMTNNISTTQRINEMEFFGMRELYIEEYIRR